METHSETERLSEKIRYLDLEISKLKSQIAWCSDEVRWKTMEKQRLLSELMEYNR